MSDFVSIQTLLKGQPEPGFVSYRISDDQLAPFSKNTHITIGKFIEMVRESKKRAMESAYDREFPEIDDAKIMFNHKVTGALYTKFDLEEELTWLDDKTPCINFTGSTVPIEELKMFLVPKDPHYQLIKNEK